MVSPIVENKAKKHKKKKAEEEFVASWPSVSHKLCLRRQILHSNSLFTVPLVLSDEECEGFIRCAEIRGLENQGSGGPAKGEAFRDNERLADYNPVLAEMLWQSGISELFRDIIVGGKVAVGLNPNIRLYRYGHDACTQMHEWIVVEMHLQLKFIFLMMRPWKNHCIHFVEHVPTYVGSTGYH